MNVVVTVPTDAPPRSLDVIASTPVGVNVVVIVTTPVLPVTLEARLDVIPIASDTNVVLSMV